MADVAKTTRRRVAPQTVERAANNIVSLGQYDKRQTAPTGYATYTRMYKAHPIVRASVDKIAKSCVMAGYQFGPRDQNEQVNEAHLKVLTDTFSRSRMAALLRRVYVDLLVYGDAYLHITPSRLGVPYQFSRVAPQQVTIVTNEETGDIASYIVRDAQGQEAQWKPEEFVHFMLPDPDNDVYGLSPLASLSSTVAQDLFAQTYNEAFFSNSAQTGVIFNMRNASKEEVDRNREFLRKEYVGGQNAHKPLLLEGDVSVSRSVASPAEMQFIEGRKQLLTEILAVYDMPYTKLGGTSESANRSQSAENDKSFRSESISPLQSIVEEVVNEHLIFTVFGFDDIVFAHRDVDQRDEEQQMKLLLDGMTHGVYSLNLVRSKLGLPPVDGGDEPFIQTPLGLIPVSKIGEAFDVLIESKKQPDSLAMPQPPSIGKPGAGSGGSIQGAPLPTEQPDRRTE